MVPTIIVASSSGATRSEVVTVLDLPDFETLELATGPEVLEAVRRLGDVALVIADLQMPNMGGVAVCFELRLEASYGALPTIPVLLLLDRSADEFQASRSDADGWLHKPIDPLELRRTVRSLLDPAPLADVPGTAD